MYSSVSNGSWVIIIYGTNSFLFFPEELTSLALGHLIRNSLFMTISILLFLMSIAHWNGYERILWKNNSFATYTRIRSHNGQIYSTVNEHAILSRLIHLYGYGYLG